MTDNYAAVMNIEYGILVFVNRTLDDCCQQGFIIPAYILVFKLRWSPAIDREKEDVHLHYTTISKKKSLTVLVVLI